MSDKLLSLKSAAARLDVSDRTVENLISRGEIRGFQVGNRWKIEEAEIMAYIQRQKDKASTLEAHTPGVGAQIDAYVEQIEDEDEREEYRQWLINVVLKNKPGTVQFKERK